MAIFKFLDRLISEYGKDYLVFEMILKEIGGKEELSVY